MSESDIYVSSLYKEKKWGKTEGGEYTIDGFTYKGKKTFNEVIEGFKECLKKGFQSEINDIKFKVLDCRIKGT